MSKPLHESVALVEATASTDAESGVLEVEFITAGWGSSGFYSRKVVEAAAPLFAVGTHMYFDHPSATENHDRPERSVRDLAAVVVEAGTFNAATGGVRGKVKPIKAYSELLTDRTFAENVGVSIRGSATDVVVGEAEGRTGPIVEGLADITSVDFVTRAGRGGKILQVLESARGDAFTAETARIQLAEARNIGQWIESRLHLELTRIADDMFGDGRLTREERISLSSAVGDGLKAFTAALESQAPTLYTRDLWAEPTQILAAEEARGHIELTAQVTDLTEQLKAAEQTGRVLHDQLRKNDLTPDVPATRPDSTTTTESHKETSMGTIQIEETEHSSLVEKAGRVDTLESERDAARNELAARDRRDRARAIVAEQATTANVTFTPLEERGLLADLPTKADGALDETAFTTTVTEATAVVAESRGVGKVTGFGGQPTGNDNTISESDIDAAVAGAFGRKIGA